MPDIAFDLRYLRYAMVAAEYGSFRRAAEILSVSQSTVSRRVQMLERRVGISLFERHASGARATAAGERFLKDAAVGAEHLHQAIDAIAQVKRGATGALRVGLMACLANGFLAELLANYRRRFPSIDVIFEEGTSQTNKGGLVNGRLDVAFMLGSSEIKGFTAEQLWEERIFVAVPAAHRTADLEVITWADVCEETFLVTADAVGPDLADYIMRQMSYSGTNPSISVQRISCENLLTMVSQGFGITITTNSASGAGHPGVRFVPISGRQDTFSFSAVWATMNKNPALKLLIDMSHERRKGSRR